jgi:hypothetical protein
MPAFTFEKLSTPTEREATAQPAEKQRGTLGQLLHRLSEARARRSQPDSSRDNPNAGPPK